MLTPIRLAQAWAIGMVKLWKNDLHPSPGVRAGIMIFLAAMFASTVYVLPHLNHSGRAVVAAYLGAVVLVVGLVSYLFNHHWRNTFF